MQARCLLRAEASRSSNRPRKRLDRSRREAVLPRPRDQREVGSLLPHPPIVVDPLAVCNALEAIPLLAASMGAMGLGYKSHLFRWGHCHRYRRQRSDHPCQTLGVCVLPAHHAHHYPRPLQVPKDQGIEPLLPHWSGIIATPLLPTIRPAASLRPRRRSLLTSSTRLS